MPDTEDVEPISDGARERYKLLEACRVVEATGTLTVVKRSALDATTEKLAEAQQHAFKAQQRVEEWQQLYIARESRLATAEAALRVCRDALLTPYARNRYGAAIDEADAVLDAAPPTQEAEG